MTTLVHRSSFTLLNGFIRANAPRVARWESTRITTALHIRTAGLEDAPRPENDPSALTTQSGNCPPAENSPPLSRLLLLIDCRIMLASEQARGRRTPQTLQRRHWELWRFIRALLPSPCARAHPRLLSCDTIFPGDVPVSACRSTEERPKDQKCDQDHFRDRTATSEHLATRSASNDLTTSRANDRLSHPSSWRRRGTLVGV